MLEARACRAAKSRGIYKLDCIEPGTAKENWLNILAGLIHRPASEGTEGTEGTLELI